MNQIYSKFSEFKKWYIEYRESKKDRNIKQIIYAYSSGKYVSKEELCKMVEYFYARFQTISRSYNHAADEMNYEKQRWLTRMNSHKKLDPKK